MRLAALPLVAALAACSSAKPRPSPAGGLPFIEDDYPKAIAEAKSKHLPLFVDSWAPW